MNVISYIAHVIVYALILVLPLGFVVDALPDNPGGPLGLLLGVALFAYVAAVGWLATRAARRRILEDEGFFDAFVGAFNEGKLNLSFVPVIGGWFRSKPQPRSPFDGPEDPGDHRDPRG